MRLHLCTADTDVDDCSSFLFVTAANSETGHGLAERFAIEFSVGNIFLPYVLVLVYI